MVSLQSKVTQTTKLSAADGDPSDRFGFRVALSDDARVGVVGAVNDEDPNGGGAGSAYVFTYTDDGWHQQEKLVADDGDGNDGFGSDVALSTEGRIALVGAKGDEDPNGSDETFGGAGSAYVFARTDTGWNQQAKLAADDGTGGDGLGTAVTVSGDGQTALAGAPLADPNGDRSGAAYVFANSGDGWSQQAKLTPTDGDSSDQFGIAVALTDDGSTALVGAWGDEDPNGLNGGSVYVFTREGTTWSQQTKFAPEGGHPDSFGESIEVAGTTALVGSSSETAYVFNGDGGDWSQQAALVPSDGDPGDEFGTSVGLTADGTTALVGARADADPNDELSGSAYLFAQDDAGWSQQAKLAAGDGDSQDRFGGSVAAASTTAIVGAVRDESPNGEGPNGLGAGSAYVFRWPSEQTATPTEPPVRTETASPTEVVTETTADSFTFLEWLGQRALLLLAVLFGGTVGVFGLLWRRREESAAGAPDEEGDQQPTTDSETNVHARSACPSCGRSLDGSEKYCTGCGYSLTDQQCPECDADLDGEEAFCPHCGHDLSE